MNTLRIRTALMLAILLLGCLLVAAAAPSWAAPAPEDARWGTVKSLYGPVAASARGVASPDKPALAGPPGNALTGPPYNALTDRPTLEAIPLPDGSVVDIVTLLQMVKRAHPDLPLWEEPALAHLDEAGSLERNIFGSIWKWIKDHIKFTIAAFGIGIQIQTDDTCTEIIISWSGDEPFFMVMPC